MKTKDVNGVRLYPTEEEEQTVVMHWATMAAGRWPELRLLFHIPNGGKRSKTEAARFRAAGVRSGVPDLFFAVRARRVPRDVDRDESHWRACIAGTGAMAQGTDGAGIHVRRVLWCGRGD